MENKQEIKKTFNRVLQKQMTEVFRQSGNNLQIGIVISFNTLNRNSAVKLKATGQVINNAKLSNQISVLRSGDEVLMLSVDSKFVSRNYIVASFGGNYRATVLTAE